MSFLYPFFLISAAAIGIPILIHLFNFRRFKKVLFPDVRFLKELQEQTQKQSKLKHLLVLLTRIATVLSLVAAFAQPYFNKDREKVMQGARAVSIYIDNSHSMSIEKNGISMLDLAKGKAKDLIETYSQADVFQVLTNDFAYNENKFLSRDEALQKLSTIRASAATKPASAILQKQTQLLETEYGKRHQLVYISDFQKSSFPSGLTLKSDTKKYFVGVEATNQNNISIDSAAFDNPSILLNETNTIRVAVSNKGNEEVNTAISLMLNGQLKSVNNIRIKANQQTTIPIEFTTATAGWQRIQLFLNDYPISFDDTLYIAGKVSSSYKVLVLNQQGANPFLSSVFKPGSQFSIDNSNVSQVQTSLLKNYSLVILNSTSSISPTLVDALYNYMIQGGNVLVFPPTANTNDVNKLLNKSCGTSYLTLDTARLFVTNYNRSHPALNDLFVKTPENIELPTVYKHYVLARAAMSSEQKLFSFSNGDAFLNTYRVGNGSIYICASAADLLWTTFPKSYWFLPLLYKMAFANTQHPIHAYMLGKKATAFIENTKKDEKQIYQLSKGAFTSIPEQRASGSRMMLNLNNAAQDAGIYAITLPADNDSQYIGINYNRIESDLSYWNLEELKRASNINNAEWLKDAANATQEINSLQHGMPLWKVCVILALLFLAIEVCLIRFMK